MRVEQRAAGVVHQCRACGTQMEHAGDRRHYCWDCAVARALHDTLGMAMWAPPDASLDTFARADWWLVRPPGGCAMGQCIGRLARSRRVQLTPITPADGKHFAAAGQEWDVVCFAALSATDVGRQQVVTG